MGIKKCIVVFSEIPTTVPRRPGDKKVLKCGVAIIGGGKTILSLKPLALNQFLQRWNTVYVATDRQ